MNYRRTYNDTIKIVIGTNEITGWESIGIHMGISSMPWQASLGITTAQPGHKAAVLISEGDSCSLYIGSELILTGYVVTVNETISPSSHSIVLDIAAKTLDLTDCSASLVTSDLTIGDNQNHAATLSLLANKVCSPFGVKAILAKGLMLPPIPLFAINLTETPFAILDRLCRQCGVLFYDTPDGNLLITRVNDKKSSVSIEYGKDIEEISTTRSTDGRYSKITAVLQTSTLLSSPPEDANYVSQLRASEAGKSATDPGIKRNRPLLIPVDLGDANFDVAGQRVLWEVARRAGRAQPITVRVSRWYDDTGAVWRPNQPVTLTLPGDKSVRDLVIAEVTLSRTPTGSSATLLLLSAASLKPEPLVNPLNNSVITQAFNQNK